MNNERVPCNSKYNYYKYYDMNKHIYRMNYEERKARKEKENSEPKIDYKQYWIDLCKKNGDVNQ